MDDNNVKNVSFSVALLTLLILTIVMVVGLALLKLATIAVFIIAIVAISIVALINGFKMEQLQEYLVNGCKKSVLVILILMSVGMVVGSWIVSGIVPSIIYYGLKVLSPSYFLVLGFIICCIVSFFTGSSYTSVGTLGVAFMGIGYGMGINPGLTAGMVVSGSIFGDKMSPFSDTTNLAPAVAGTDIFLHIKSMLYTTVPALIISTILYFILGFRYSTSSVDMGNINLITNILKENFTVSPILLVIPIITIVLAVKKVPSLIALIIGAVVGTIAAFIFQPSFGAKIILNSLASGFNFDFGNAVVNRLLNRGGISSMMTTVSLAILALAFGEILQGMGVLNVLLSKMENILKSPRNLVVGTLFTCLLTVILTASQYMAIILPGEIFRESYKKLKIAPYVLSRTLEDGGTIFSFLVPWSMAAIYVSGILEVTTLEYLPFSFFPVLCPLIAIILALTGIGIFREDGTQLKGKA